MLGNDPKRLPALSTPLFRQNSTKFTPGLALFVVYVIQFSCMLKKTAFFSKKMIPKGIPKQCKKLPTSSKCSNAIFQIIFYGHFTRILACAACPIIFRFFCFASRRILALTCPGHINRVPNCGEMLPSFKTQSHNFFTNSLHLALKLACLRVGRTPKTGGPARPGPANSRPGPAHGQNSKNPARPMGRWGGTRYKGLAVEKAWKGRDFSPRPRPAQRKGQPGRQSEVGPARPMGRWAVDILTC